MNEQQQGTQVRVNEEKLSAQNQVGGGHLAQSAAIQASGNQDLLATTAVETPVEQPAPTQVEQA